MATTTKQQNKVPELRFTEFNDDWQTSILGDLFTFHSGGTPSKSEAKYWGGKIPWVTAASMRGLYYEDTEHSVTESAIGNGTRMVPAGTLLLLVRGSMLFKDIPVGIAAVDTTFNQDVKALIAKKELDNEFYLYWFLHKKPYVMNMVTGTGIGAGKLDTEELKSISTPIPTKAEQSKIADFLGSVDAWLDNLRQQKTALETYKRGMMQKIFTQQVRFKDDEGNDFPEWEVKDLDSLCSIRTGKKDVNQGNPDGLYPFFTCAKEHTYSDGYSFDCDAILIAGNGEVGHSLRYSGKFEAYQRTYVLSDFTIDYNYIWTVVNTLFEDYVINQTQKGAMPYIKLGTLKSFQVPVPNEQEQQKIADFLTTIDETITAKAKEITRVEQWKKGLMQKMFV